MGMKQGSIVLGLAVMALAACGRDTGPAPEAPAAPHVKAAPVVKRGPSPEELTAGMVEAVTIGKSTVPVNVKFDIAEAPVVGRPVEVVVAVMPQVSADHAVLTVTPSAELPFPAGADGPIEMPSVEPDQVYRLNVKLTPAVEGVQLLNLSVALQHDDVTESRVFSIPVIVAAAAAPGAASDATASARK